MVEHEKGCPYNPVNVAQPEWMPMETVPKDGSSVVLLVSQWGEKSCVIAEWVRGAGSTGWKTGGCINLSLGAEGWFPIPSVSNG